MLFSFSKGKFKYIVGKGGRNAGGEEYDLLDSVFLRSVWVFYFVLNNANNNFCWFGVLLSGNTEESV